MTEVSKRLVVIISSFFYIGYLPASGTLASLVAIPVFIVLSLLGSERFAGSHLYILALLGLSVLGVRMCGLAEKVFKKHDSHKIVFDEVVGFMWAMLWLPVSFWTIAGAFVLFRIMDVLKPYPISISQNLRGGSGVMADDIFAGLVAMGLMQILILLF